MAHTDTNISNLKINRGTYANIQANLSSIGENELIITTDKAVPIPTTSDSGKVVAVNSSGEYELQTQSGGMTNPMTTQGDIIYGGSSGTPTRLAKGTAGQVLTMNSGATAPIWSTPSGGSGVEEISTQYIRITSLNAGTYKLTYSGTKYIYYNGSSSTSTHTVTGLSGEVILIVNKYSTTYWHWYYINGTTSYATLYYGYTSSSSGSTGSKSLNDIRTTDNNYYPIRSYTSGLQISTYSGSLNCQLYVPYATTSQKGVISAGTGLSVSSGVASVSGVSYTTTAPSSANTSGDLKFVVLSSEPSTKYDGYLYIITE